jgi:hypothetical protein
MAAMTMEPVILKKAMTNIGLDYRFDDLLDELDEMELDRNLSISMEQARKGQKKPARQALKEIRERVLNGKKG